MPVTMKSKGQWSMPLGRKIVWQLLSRSRLQIISACSPAHAIWWDSCQVPCSMRLFLSTIFANIKPPNLVLTSSVNVNKWWTQVQFSDFIISYSHTKVWYKSEKAFGLWSEWHYTTRGLYLPANLPRCVMPFRSHDHAFSLYRILISFSRKSRYNQIESKPWIFYGRYWPLVNMTTRRTDKPCSCLKLHQFWNSNWKIHDRTSDENQRATSWNPCWCMAGSLFVKIAPSS